MTDKDPKFSIIVPVFNTEKYLRDCIDSICSQTYTDFESLIIDDGSTDGSGIICDEFSRKDNRLRIIHKKNEGVSIARNIGLKHAKGKYIIFVDSDDWIDKDFLQVIIDNIGESDLMYFGHRLHFPTGNIISYHPHSSQCNISSTIEEELLNLKHNPEEFEYFGFTWNKVFRKDIIICNSILFKHSLSMREDELFTTIYCKFVKQLRIISSPIYNYRFTDNGLRAKHYNTETYIKYINHQKELIPGWKTKQMKDFEYLRCANIMLIASERSKYLLSCIKCYTISYKLKSMCSNMAYIPVKKILKLPRFTGYIAVFVKFLMSKI